MKRYLLIPAFLAVLLSGCQFLQSTTDKASSKSSGSMPEQSKESLFSGSYFDLLARGGSFQCSWSTTTDSEEISGTTYVSGERLRSEADMNDPLSGDPMTVYSIFDSEYIYSWTSQSNTGTKFAKAAIEDEGPSGDYQEEIQEPVQDFNQDVDFDCSSWAPDDSMLTPPTDTEFQDFSAMMQESLDAIGNDLPEGVNFEDACSFCSQLPEGQAREACLDNC